MLQMKKKGNGSKYLLSLFLENVRFCKTDFSCAKKSTSNFKKKHLIALNMKFNIAKVWKENIYAKKRTQVQAYSWTDLKVPILKSQYK